MAPERSLLPPQPPSSSPSHASVIGIVPQSIHTLLASPASLYGCIDQHSSGLSHLVSNNEIHIWEHSVQNQHEELVAPSHGSLKITHPEYNHDEGNDLKVVTLSPKENTHYIYAASPSGVICLWIIDTKNDSLRFSNPEQEGECNACLRLDLDHSSLETITCLSSFAEWIFASTSNGTVYKIHMTARPLSLRAKSVCQQMEGGLMSGLYNVLFTPKKKMRNTTMLGQQEEIVALIACQEGSSTAGGRSPPRSKVAKLSPFCKIVTFTSDLSCMEWKVSLTDDDANEGVVTKKKLFDRKDDGTLNLQVLDDNLDGYTRAELTTDPIFGKNNSIVAVIRISCGDVGKTRVYVLRMGHGGEESLTIMNSIWLDRYAGEAIANGLECYGLVDGDANDGCVVYVGFGPRREVAGKDSVTISAINFADSRVKDLDLIHNIVPSIVTGCINFDCTSGGCVFLASSALLGGASVRFPNKALSQPTENTMDNVGDENVLAIKSHLTSAFRQFANKSGSGNTNHAAIARSVVPPSIDSCSASVLSAAAVKASEEFLLNGGGRNGLLSPSYKSSPVAALREKLRLHTDFINFLLHAGAYRKISASARIKLRDHAEMIETTQTCFMTCQQMIEKLDSTATDSVRRDEISKIRHELNRAFDGVADNVTDLPSRWASLQQTCDNDLFFITSVMICNGIGMALQCRQNSASLYDIPTFDVSAEFSTAPWTSSLDVLRVLQTQLEDIDRFESKMVNTSYSAEELTALFREVVEDISSALLGGHRDIVLRSADDVNAWKMYEHAKRLCIPLLRRFVNDNGSDLVALQASLTHEHYEGIVQICHDHRRSWMYRGPFSDKQTDETYDLRLMLQCLPESTRNLENSVDFVTKMNFRSYVLRWYADKGMKSKVLELGKECPNELSQLVRSDRSFSELSWIDGVRSSSFQSARESLLNNSTTDLWEKETSLGIAKLTNTLCMSTGASGGDRSNEINNGLTLVSAQRMLQEEDSDSNSEVMSAEELISLAASKIKSGANPEDILDCVICGLEVAATISADQRNDYLSCATAIWEAAIQADMPKWKLLLQETSRSVAGIPDTVLYQSKNTVFVEVCAKLAQAAEEKLLRVGYLTNPAVRHGIRQSMGLDDGMEQLFVSSAQVACT